MSAPNFTPGPWKFDNHLGCKPIKGGKSGTHKQAQYEEIACTVGLSNEERDEANARLIAAAPDLYEAALRGLRNTEAFNAAYGAETMDADAAFIRATLAKAVKP